ncbi:MAG TPA: Gfo/Idh/MocA family oxidoreductase [Acidimicrobiales bacterium]|jgi:predicted dehydrogenase|nr:Gfo/Idh/MocA family oxidoreductase [Acidimicrobiales bacterium]
MATVRIGILGAARIAPSALIKPARHAHDVEVVSVAAREPERAQAFAHKHHIAGTHPSYEALIADPDIDAVYNPLPNGLHGRWTLAAIAAGKHVMCEKPFTADAEEARTVARAAAGTGLVIMEAFHYRYHPLASRISQILRGDEVGKIERIEITFSAPLAKRGDIRYRLDLAGGAQMDMGCYTVSLLRLLAGAEPTVLKAKAKLSSPGVDRAMRAEYSLPGGGTARTRCSMFSSSVLRMRATVTGDGGELSVFNPFAPQFLHRLTVRTDGVRRVEHVTREPTYNFQLRAFADAINGGEPVLTPPEDAIKNMAVIDAIYQAAGMEPRQPTS